MRAFALACVLTTAFVTAAEARRWVGTAASFQGASIALRGSLRQLSPTTLTGWLRCRVPKSTGGVCLGKRGSVVVELLPNGMVTADLIFRRTGVVCSAIGEGDAYAISAQYACARSGVLLDQGVLILNRR